MTPGEIIAGVVFLMLGGLILRFNRAVGRHFARSAREEHNPRYSLLNVERAERIQDAESHAGDNRVKAIFFGVLIVVMGIVGIVGGIID